MLGPKNKNIGPMRSDKIIAEFVHENLIAGNIQGQRTLTIKTAGQTTTLQITLYVVPQESA